MSFLSVGLLPVSFHMPVQSICRSVSGQLALNAGTNVAFFTLCMERGIFCADGFRGTIFNLSLSVKKLSTGGKTPSVDISYSIEYMGPWEHVYVKI